MWLLLSAGSGQAIELYTDLERAQTQLAEILVDEPVFEGELWIEKLDVLPEDLRAAHPN